MSKEDYKDRRRLLALALEEVNSGSYSPKRIHGFLSAPKGSSVARFVPVFTYWDTAVYFACMQRALNDPVLNIAIQNMQN